VKSRAKVDFEAPKVFDTSGRVYSPGNPPPTVGVPTYVQAAQPAASGPWVWWQTLPGGDLTLWIEDGI
jgi:hypothetical protein